jgi:hypothetical protein
VLAGKDVPRTSSIYADVGSAIHKLGEIKLSRPETDLTTFIGTAYDATTDTALPAVESDDNIIYDADMIEMATDYADRVMQLVADVEGTLYVEVRVFFEDLIEGGSGTADAIIVSEKHRKILVVDLKTGRGHRVDPVENSQLMLYGLGALRTMDMVYDDFRSLVDEVELHIIQPPLNNFDHWSTPVDHLEAFGLEAKTAAQLAMSPDAPFIAGETQCRWCPIKNTCTVRAEWALESVGQVFDTFGEAVSQMESRELEVYKADELNPENLSIILSRIPFIKQWCSDMEAYAKTIAKQDNGHGLVGYKFVEGRKSRAWSDRAKAEAYLLDLGLAEADMYEKVFVSPAKAEKLVGKGRQKELKDFITESRSEPIMVPESDKRLAITFAGGEEFAAIAAQ